MDTLLSLRVFCLVAEHRSFTLAANRLGMSVAMTSKHIHHLESRLGARLLNRTSRHVSPTEIGQLYFSQVRSMLDGLDEVEASVGNVTVMPKGTLKLSAPVWMANAFIARAIADYHEHYPEMTFDLDLSGRITNLVDEGLDLALRAMTTERLDPGLVARPLIDVPFHLVASPTYLKRAGTPVKLEDLNGHALLQYSGMNTNGNLDLKWKQQKGTVKFKVVMRSDNENMLHLSALEGMGLVFLPQWMTRTYISKGQLEPVLEGGITFNASVHAVYPSRKYLSAKVRTFIDFLSNRASTFEKE